MAKKKTKTTETQTQSGTQAGNSAFSNTASYGQITPENTADIQAFRDYRPQIDPSIAYGAAAERNRLNSSFINPLGGNYSPHITDAIKRSENRDIDQRASQAFRSGQYDVNQQRSGQLGSLAALTAPRIVQVGSSGTGSSSGSYTGNMSGTSNTVQGNNLFGDLLQIAQAGSSAAMM